MRHKLAIAFVIASTACITNIAYPADETQVATFSLNHATSLQAATVVRTIVGVRKFEAVDDHTIKVHDTRENLELTAAVVKMLNTTDDTSPLPAGNDSVIVAVVLERTSSVEAMNALRELRIARIATAGEKRIFLRDTDSQIQAALEVIGRVEGNHKDP